MSPSKTGPFALVAIVIVGCLASGVWISMSDRDAPSLVVAVVLACAVSALLYSILGSVGEANCKLGPVKMGGSAAVLIGSTYLFDMLLEPQLAARRDARLEDALERASFDFERHVSVCGGLVRHRSRDRRAANRDFHRSRGQAGTASGTAASARESASDDQRAR